MVTKPGSSFAQRLNHLVEHVHPAGRGPWRDSEISEGIQAEGGHLSGTQIGKLRKGLVDNPTIGTARMLAGFFGVPASFFTDEDPEDVSDQIAVAVLKRDALAKATLLRMGQLSRDHVSMLSDLSEKLLRLDQLHAANGPDARQTAPGDEPEE